MNKKKFTDFIQESSTSSSPDYLAGVKNDATVKYVPSAVVLLGSLIGLDMNTTDDQEITLSGGAKYAILDVVVTNASTNLNTAKDATLNDAILRGGNVFWATHVNGGGGGVDRSLSLLVTPDNFVNSTMQMKLSTNYVGPTMNDSASVCNTNTIYFSLSTPQGATATCDIYVYGYILE